MKVMVIRRLFVDVEATGDGFDPNHTILQICARYFENEKFVSEYYKDYSDREDTVYAYEAIRRRAEKNREAGHISAEEDLPNFMDWLHKQTKGHNCYFIGYNCAWDFRHVKNWMKKGGLHKRYFFEPCVCVMLLCTQRFDTHLSLSKSAERLGVAVDESKLHDARYDTDLTIELYKQLVQKLKS